MMISNIASGIISMEYGLHGPNMVIVTACATSNHNIGEAWRIIKFGDADAFVCGGAEAAILPMGLAGFGSMKALSTRNDEPEGASRPFDKNRDGFVMGEGAGVVVIEELEHALKRGAKIYAELIGYGVSADAYHLSAPSPDGSGPAYAIGMALKHGKKNPEDVDYLNAHATSTGLGDVAETKAIKLAFGDYATNGLMVSSTKSMTGHMLGAAGGVELIASVMAIKDGVIPPTINVEDQDPECDLDVVPERRPRGARQGRPQQQLRLRRSQRVRARQQVRVSLAHGKSGVSAGGGNRIRRYRCQRLDALSEHFQIRRSGGTRVFALAGRAGFRPCARRLAAGESRLRLQAAVPMRGSFRGAARHFANRRVVGHVGFRGHSTPPGKPPLSAA